MVETISQGDHESSNQNLRFQDALKLSRFWRRIAGCDDDEHEEVSFLHNFVSSDARRMTRRARSDCCPAGTRKPLGFAF